MSMVSEWMTAMSQVRGAAEEVFSHLLIRSGLLREPAPGAVGFVHRTFQDYLGAKATVEARDFGVLVQHAHDDQWHDVVQMAVGHARADERARLLLQLLKRADRTRKHRHRLVLLATASLEHAPELDPAVRAEVRRRTAELLPPRSWQEAEELAGVGDLILELLPGPEEAQSGGAAGWPVRTAALVGGDAAYELIRRYRDDEQDAVAAQLTYAWSSFDPEPYAQEILASRTWNDVHLSVEGAGQMAALRYVPEAGAIRLQGNHGDLSPLVSRHGLKKLFVYDNRALTDIAPMAAMRSLTEVGLSMCPGVRDLSPLSELPLTWLSLVQLHPDIPKHQLEPLTDVRQLNLGHRFPVDSIGELALSSHLTSLTLSRETGDMSLEGLEQWPGLEELGLYDHRHLPQVTNSPLLHNLSRLVLGWQELPGLDALAGCTGLRALTLNRCRFPTDLAPLRELQALTHLYLYGQPDDDFLDLAPLADLEGLTVHIGFGTRIIGSELFPPERIVRND